MFKGLWHHMLNMLKGRGQHSYILPLPPPGARHLSGTSNTDNGTTNPFTHRKAFAWYHRQRMLTGWH
jgi:hypothetical protein